MAIAIPNLRESSFPLERTWTRRSDLLFAAIACAMAGYVLGGRGFAYLPFPPLFVGEILLLLGGLVLLTMRFPRVLQASAAVWPVGLLMVWGLWRTLPYVDQYKIGALRDAVLYGYGAYAVVLAALIIEKPQRLADMQRWMGKLAPVVLVAAPALALLGRGGDHLIPTIGNNIPIINTKGGDLAVHVTGAFAYAALIRSTLPGYVIAPLVAVALAACMTVRAGLMAFIAGTFVLGLLRPKSGLLLGLVFFCVLSFSVAWGLDLKYRPNADYSREISAQQLVDGFATALGFKGTLQTEMSGTREWRLMWWETIINYTFNGPLYWTGRGFGVNLANTDGFQVYEDESLRSPHNGHLTFLARGGVPMFAMWLLCLGWMGYRLAGGYLHARRNGQREWANLYLFLGVYMVAFMVNASFDVFLEGPMGGVWFWCLYGIAAGATQVHRIRPEVLTPSVLNRPAPEADGRLAMI